MRTLKTSLAAIAAGAAMLIASPAFAHAHLVGSTPAANATVTAPRTITLTFNERVVPAFSKIELTMPDHGMNVPIETTVSRDGKSVVGTPQSPLAKGSYAVHWTAAGADGHKQEGNLTFKVG